MEPVEPRADPVEPHVEPCVEPVEPCADCDGGPASGGGGRG